MIGNAAYEAAHIFCFGNLTIDWNINTELILDRQHEHHNVDRMHLEARESCFGRNARWVYFRLANNQVDDLVLQIPSATVLLIQLLGPKSWKCFIRICVRRRQSNRTATFLCISQKA